MYHFATLLDVNYLAQGLTLRQSLTNQDLRFKFYILCLDDHAFDYLINENQHNTIPVKISELESFFPELLQAKNNRKYVEYIFTLSPFWPLYLLETYTEIDLITTMDADLFFFNDPSILLTNSNSYSIQITPHNFCERNQYKVVYGKYNVSFQTFRRNEIALECLNTWKDNCLNWCYDKLEDDRFADQKYLDSWQDLYGDNVLEYSNEGSGVAPWNIQNKKLSLKKNIIYVNNSPLIFYHFHHLRLFNKRFISSGLSNYGIRNKFKILSLIYSPYLKILNQYKKTSLSNKIFYHRYNSFEATNSLLYMFKSNRMEIYINKNITLPLTYYNFSYFKNFIFSIVKKYAKNY